MADNATLIDTTTVVHPDELTYYHRNARRGDVAAIARSLLKHTQYKPITVNVGTLTGRPNEVLAGNHTLQAIRKLHTDRPDDPMWAKVKAHWVDVDDDKCRDINVADNRTGELGGYDYEQLHELVKDVPAVDLPDLGYSVEDLADLAKLAADAISDIDTEPGRGSGDKLALWSSTVGEPDIEPEAGSVWQMGHHTVAVASVHDGWQTWAKLLKPGMLFAPYPTLLLPYVDAAIKTPMLMVQPDPFIAGWLLTKWNRVNPDTQAVKL